MRINFLPVNHSRCFKSHHPFRPLIYIVDHRPPVPVGMDLLLRHLKPVPHPVEMVDIHKPHPGMSPSQVTPSVPSHWACRHS